MKTFSKTVTIIVPDSEDDEHAKEQLERLLDADDVDFDMAIIGVVISDEATKQTYDITDPDIVAHPSDWGDEDYEKAELWTRSTEAFVRGKCDDQFHTARFVVAHDKVCTYCGANLAEINMRDDLNRLGITMTDYKGDALNQEFNVCCVGHAKHLAEVFDRMHVDYNRDGVHFTVRLQWTR